MCPFWNYLSNLQPLWLIPNFPERRDFVHLTYEGGDHYNSVRFADDHLADEPGGPIEARERTALHPPVAHFFLRSDLYGVMKLQLEEAAKG